MTPFLHTDLPCQCGAPDRHHQIQFRIKIGVTDWHPLYQRLATHLVKQDVKNTYILLFINKMIRKSPHLIRHKQHQQAPYDPHQDLKLFLVLELVLGHPLLKAARYTAVTTVDAPRHLPAVKAAGAGEDVATAQEDCCISAIIAA